MGIKLDVSVDGKKLVPGPTQRQSFCVVRPARSNLPSHILRVPLSYDSHRVCKQVVYDPSNMLMKSLGEEGKGIRASFRGLAFRVCWHQLETMMQVSLGGKKLVVVAHPGQTSSPLHPWTSAVIRSTRSCGVSWSPLVQGQIQGSSIVPLGWPLPQLSIHQILEHKHVIHSMTLAVYERV